MASESEPSWTDNLWILLVIVALIWIFRNRYKGPVKGGPGGYANLELSAAADETRAYLNQKAYVDPVHGVWANREGFTGLYDAWFSLKSAGLDTTAVEAQIRNALENRHANG